MKKLLVLMLVLGMASLANAVPSALTDISITYVGTTFTVTGNVAKEINIGIYDDAGTYGMFSAPQKFVAAGGFAYANLGPSPYAGVDVGTKSNTVSVPSVLVTTGEWFSFVYTGPAKMFTIYDYDAQGAAIGTITATPEPATLAILGLGALLLRRKK